MSATEAEDTEANSEGEEEESGGMANVGITSDDGSAEWDNSGYSDVTRQSND